MNHSTRISLTRCLATASVLGLIVLGLGWELAWAPLRPGGSWLALKVLPLCIPLAGILKNRLYTYRWVSLLVWLYAAEGALRVSTERGLSCYFALAELLLSLTLFICCVLHVRWRLAAAPKNSAL